ncbi:hypothetical protein [Streptomyces sp. NPDC096311]|uniref:hypothetical protein n=1 Tax=Streptomyces sp. NPDC096311 TaxID=3366083 RepID=UPI0038006E49
MDSLSDKWSSGAAAYVRLRSHSDFAQAGELFEVWATNADAAMGLRVRRIGEDGRSVADEVMQPCGGGLFRAELRAEPGLWTVEVYSNALGYSCRDVQLVV